MAETLTFQALQLANEQRNAYGLRYNDYERYRKHCANRTHRLRSTLKMTHGKGREFKKLPPVKIENIKDGYLQLLLFEAERAWTYSQELSQLAALPANKDKASAIRKNATSRFRKAVNWATQLLSHCQALHASGRLPASGLIQATVYTLVLNGRFLRHRFAFDDALAQLCVARALLDALAAHAGTSRDQALAVAFADEIGAEIRHSAHELGTAQAYDVDAIVAETAAAHRTQLVDGYDTLLAELAQENAGGAAAERKKLKPLLWEGEPVPIRNPELVDVLLKVQEAEEKLRTVSEGKAAEPVADAGKKGKVGKSHRSKQGVAAYDAILLALSDAEAVARKLVEAQQLSGGSSTAPVGTRDLQFVHAFIVYQLLARRIQRDLLLISTLLHQSQPSSHRPGEASTSRAGTSKQQVDARLFPAVVKLLDTVIQSLTQMRTLAIVDDSPDLAASVDARISFSKARRCQYLAKAYIAAKKYAEAVALMQRATIHIREAQSSLSLLPSPSEDPISTSELPFYALEADSLSKLQEQIDAENLKCKKDWLSYNGGDATGKVDRTTYKKPLFFDIALNYAELDMDRLMERAGKTVSASAPALAAPVPQRASSGPTEVKSATSRAKVEEIQRPMTPEPSAAPGKGGLTSLLGGWWGRK
ncbi:signal recognition particle subunit SRP68 [Phanerochaete sordida]|uniref:Signal recognition particle subunit SRP68 n=1 Tax=Phanerochaete sordida TaxID=48140 RepID=A0A9P3LH01_9APHY|nr:signal recognition particle subunit SRP68 [Phanerochaete sordida]